MMIPPAGLIEAAADQIQTLHSGTTRELDELADQQYELEIAGAIGPELPQIAVLAFRDGYELGLQVARVMIMQNTAVQLAGLKPEEIL